MEIGEQGGKKPGGICISFSLSGQGGVGEWEFGEQGGKKPGKGIQSFLPCTPLSKKSVLYRKRCAENSEISKKAKEKG